jgi:hypothetical protein
MKLPIESFDKYRYQCKECRRKSKKEKYKTNVINQGGSKNGIGEVKTASGTNIGLPDWSKDYSISMSPFTYEELLRKQVWYDEPKIHGNRKRWVEPVNTLIKRLVDNSSTTKVYNYKTSQKKRSKYATIEKTVSLDTYSLLKETHTRLKITEPKITYDEIIWRLIENDKTIK